MEVVTACMSIVLDAQTFLCPRLTDNFRWRKLSVMDDVMSTATAAARIGVSERQVRNLVRSGGVAAVADNAIRASSVERYIATRAGRSGRAWTEATAWQAIALLEDLDARVIGQTQRARVRAALRAMSAERVVSSVRNRARTTRCVGYRSSATRISSELVDAGIAEARLGLSSVDRRVDGYATESDVQRIIARYHLRVDAGADDAAVLRAVSTPHIDLVRQVRSSGDTLAALSLAESQDPRERSAGLRYIGEALDRVRRGR